ncbi:MAG: hypothetical protein ACLTSX_00890 [Collinsella sp.]
MDEIKSRATKKLPKYEYPDEVLTSAKLNGSRRITTPFQVRRSDCIRISKLEAQGGKGIFGGGLLLSERAAAERAAAERAAAERAAAERAAAHKWELSERERAMVHALSKPC